MILQNMKYLRVVVECLACLDALLCECMTSLADPFVTLIVCGQVSDATAGAAWQGYSDTNSSLSVMGLVGTAASNIWKCDL